MILETLVIPLVGNSKDLLKALEEANKKTHETTKSMSEKLKNVGDGMMKVGGAMSLGITTPVVAGMTQAVNAASDLNETVSKVGVVFGDQADEVMAFGENAAQALGMSKNEALSAAGTYGNLFVSMGMTNEASADMSMGLVQLASDLGSFNNMASTDVLEKLRAGLTGETEPLKSLGVNLSAAAVQAKAFDMGLVDLNVSVLDVEKAQLKLKEATKKYNDLLKGSPADQEEVNRLMLKQEKAQIALEKAQSKLNEATTKYGSDSLQARDATVGLQEAQAKLTEANNALTEARQSHKSDPLEIEKALLAQKQAEEELQLALGGEAVELDAAAKAQATYALILEQTTTAQGDFARTSDGLANSTKIASAEFENAKAALGEQLLPMVTDLTKKAGEVIVKFNELEPSTKKNIVVFLGIAAAAGPVITAIGGIISVGTTVAGLFGAGGAIATSFTYMSTVALPAIGGAIAAIGLPVLLLIGAFVALGLVIYHFGDDAWNTLVMIDKIVDEVGNRIKSKFIDMFINGIASVNSAISGLMGWINSLAARLSSLTIPSWLVMHSPPPLAQSLALVSDEMKDLSRTQLPEFESQMNIRGVISPNVRNFERQTNNSDIEKLIPYLKQIAESAKTDEYKLAKFLVEAMRKS